MQQNPADALFEPLTEEAVASAFRYLRAIQAGDARIAGELIFAEPHMSALLTGIAEGIVEAGTSLPGPDDDAPTWDSFALEALGKVFLYGLCNWQQAGPDAAPGIAQTILVFIAEVLVERESRDNIAHALNTYESCARGRLLLDARAGIVRGLPGGHHRPVTRAR
ncbi:hypothetical protein [Streptomyces sp. NBC_00083]|uniref:hypothetical protein n=1 Tax=Streptomyces sp. NBC_00083 TaxID=2975647 RepID=UPI00224CCEF8|nr:hypothetical protein [Streptomyces sp. NBC_00083]MCX5388381.1 hypothetical protein [Streptomyces sp. NBC_00083]